jgi:L-2,4-diaminobutyrate decarboxylase
MGLGRDGAVAVPSDEGFRMRRDALEQAYRETRARGFQVVAVVASACSTAAGVFDPLDEIAAFCRTHDLWLHVDGAHGAAAALSRRYRHLVDGIEQADSVVWDAHKMLMMPALVSAVLFRDGADARAAFAQEASYLYAATSDEGWHDIGTRTLECTKRTMSLTLYGTLLTGGEELFTGNVERLFDLARELADLLGGAPDFELPVAPQANIVCFRHCPNGAALAPEELDRLQAYLRAAVLQGGRHYIVQTRLRGALYLRVTVMNPFSDRPVQAALIDELRRHGRAWLENGRP